MVRVDVVGMSHLKDAPGRQVRQLRPRDVPKACKAPILAIATAALGEVAPEPVECWLRRGRRLLAICGDQWSSDSVARWREHGHGTVLREAEIDVGLDGLCRRVEAGLARYLVTPQSLLPVGHQPSRRLLDIVTALGLTHPVHHVEQLAERSGMSRSHLVHVTRKELGCTPTTLCQMYVLLQASRAAVDGVSRADVAVMLGYSDTSALAHALASIAEEQPWVLPPELPCLIEECAS